MKTLPEMMTGAMFAPWRQAQARHQHLQHACTTALAACDLAADACAVERLADDGTLHLTAASPAVATRLRQSLPTFLCALRAACTAGVVVHTCEIVAVRPLVQTPE